MMKNKIKNIFIDGPILPSKIAESIQKHQSKKNIGGHNIFLGQVRADVINQQKVSAIDYSAQTEIANQICYEIRETAFKKHNLTCMHIYHSLGIVNAGEICFFVFVSSEHRAPVFESLKEIVNEIKEKLPIFGKEIFEDQSYKWKVNQ